MGDGFESDSYYRVYLLKNVISVTTCRTLSVSHTKRQFAVN
jgi:hypothetical protein